LGYRETFDFIVVTDAPENAPGIARCPPSPNDLWASCLRSYRKASVGKYEVLLLRILRGASDANIPFEDLCRLLGRFGFDERIRGDHHIFSKPNVAEILNLQPRGRHAKPYQVKQVRGVIVKYRLGDDADGK
jgi:hypothetical protein